MSTFDGIVEEFPDIRIDYFRHYPGRKQPAACFLSHVHSDHLLGLESLRMPFVYCSMATRQLLLNMEKYPHRINFSKGILEARKQTYKHLKMLLRPLPLQSPVEIELGPRSRIRVTLFDANHCPGAVMFLIEGDNKAILYTGDIRAEPWWVNSITQSPSMLSYVAGLKTLDCIYLDTTFATHRNVHKEFPTKAEGLTELISKLKSCPKDAIFYFRAWTLGYEDVWQVLHNLLGSQIHVESYNLRLFQAIAGDGLQAHPGPAMVGFMVGHAEQPGCLTTNRNVRIHSCEPGTACHAELKKKGNVVWISPIITRLQDGTEVAELGAGGGGGDLRQTTDLELGAGAILDLCKAMCDNLGADDATFKQLEKVLTRALEQRTRTIKLEAFAGDQIAEPKIQDFVNTVLKHSQEAQAQETSRVIHFPYSRHSSYSELRHLIGALKPKDICPCTVDLDGWDKSVSMATLFGDLCSSSEFLHDKRFRADAAERQAFLAANHNSESQQTEQASDDGSVDVISSHVLNVDEDENLAQMSVVPEQPPEAVMEAVLTSYDQDTFTRPESAYLDNLRDNGYNDRVDRYLETYEAARICLETGDDQAWRRLRMRSLGYRGHTDIEPVI